MIKKNRSTCKVYVLADLHRSAVSVNIDGKKFYVEQGNELEYQVSFQVCANERSGRRKISHSKIGSRGVELAELSLVKAYGESTPLKTLVRNDAKKSQDPLVSRILKSHAAWNLATLSHGAFNGARVRE